MARSCGGPKGGEGRGQNFAFFPTSRSHFRFFSLSLWEIFSCFFFFSLSLSGGLLEEFWWCFGLLLMRVAGVLQVFLVFWCSGGFRVKIFWEVGDQGGGPKMAIFRLKTLWEAKKEEGPQNGQNSMWGTITKLTENSGGKHGHLETDIFQHAPKWIGHNWSNLDGHNRIGPSPSWIIRGPR